MKNIFLGSVLIISFALSGCVGSVKWREMDITTDVRSSYIHNLKNNSTDLDLFRQGEKLMKNGFLDIREEEYGYYEIDYSIKYSNVTLGDTGWYWLQVWFLYTLALIGVPTETETIYLAAYLKIYDSNSKLIKEYSKTGSFKQTAGIYYGHNPTKRAEKEFIKLFSEILQMANMQSREINQALEAAGPITQSKAR